LTYHLGEVGLRRRALYVSSRYTLRGGVKRGAEAARGAQPSEEARDRELRDQHPLLMRHLPAAALVVNLPAPRGAGSDPASGSALLRHEQLATLCAEITAGL
jgi:hypothetical protein